MSSTGKARALIARGMKASVIPSSRAALDAVLDAWGRAPEG